jgi:hypothetical protein
MHIPGCKVQSNFPSLSSRLVALMVDPNLSVSSFLSEFAASLF